MKTGYLLLSCLTVVALYACGHNAGNGTDANGGGDGGLNNVDDAGNLIGNGDAPFSGMCTPTAAQCSNCKDDDGDGKIDGFDPECTGPADNDESSFKTGIPGDNIDATTQDCFFDGNSGSGDDKCAEHTCCLLQAPDKATCHMEAPLANQNKYDPTQCYQPFGTVAPPQQCIDNCAPLSPPGCDCFGCCTICNKNFATTANPGGCFNIEINPSVSPNCNETNLNDPAQCKTCVQSTTCTGGTCGGSTCVLCPGQDPSTLPTSCNGSTTCPSGINPCDSGGNCATGLYCSNGCCIGVIL